MSELKHEKWRPFPDQDYSMHYMVSDHGRVASLRSKGSRERILSEPKILALTKTPGGYPMCTANTKAAGPRTFSVHRLVLRAFIGEPEQEGWQACHSNGDQGDNRLSNLRWDSAKNNCADRITHGTACRGERHPGAKLKDSDVVAIRSRHANGESITAIAKLAGVSINRISRIVKREVWKHI